MCVCVCVCVCMYVRGGGGGTAPPVLTHDTPDIYKCGKRPRQLLFAKNGGTVIDVEVLQVS